MPSGTHGSVSWTLLESDDRIEVQLAGEFDLAAAADVTTELGTRFDIADRPVTIDLSGITFIDSTGLRFLLDAKRRLDGRRVDLTLANVSPIAHRVLEVSGLESFFVLNSTEHDAVPA